MKRRNFLTIATAVALLPSPFAWATALEAYTDLMPQFWVVYDIARHQPMQARIESLMSGFFVPNADIYAGAGVTLSADNVANWLKNFDSLAESVRALSLKIPETIHAQLPRFQANLRDFDINAGRIYFLPSLFWFDGHLQPWRGIFPLFIGVDGIVQYHGTGADLTVFINHELFHVYHAQRNPAMLLDPNPPIFVELWIEGLAVYASQLMSPSAERVHVLLDDLILAAAKPGTLTYAAAELLKCLDSKSSKDDQRFFLTGYVGDLPARTGYLVGLTIAERIGRSMSLIAMAKLDQSAVRDLVARELVTVVQGV